MHNNFREMNETPPRLEYFLRNLSQLQNLRCASLPPHSNAPYDVMENWENLGSNKRIKQIVKASGQ